MSNIIVPFKVGKFYFTAGSGYRGQPVCKMCAAIELDKDRIRWILVSDETHYLMTENITYTELDGRVNKKNGCRAQSIDPKTECDEVPSDYKIEVY